MKHGLFSLALCLGASAAVTRRQTTGCPFQLTASGSESGTVGELTDGQVRIGGGLTQSTFTILNGAITDQNGKGCILTSPTTQFQCDTGAPAQSGFSISSTGQLESGGSTTFFACPTGENGEYNIYTQSQPNAMCVQISLTASSCFNSGSSTSASSSHSSTATSQQGSASGQTETQTSTSTGTASTQTHLSNSTRTVTATSTAAPQTETGSGSTSTKAGVTSTQAEVTSSQAGVTSSQAGVTSTEAGSTSTEAPQTETATGVTSSEAGTTSTKAETTSTSAPRTETETVSVASTHASSAIGSVVTSAETTATEAQTETETLAGSSTSTVETSVQTATITAATGTAHPTTCPTSLSGAYQFPHLIIPVSSSAPNTAAGTSFNGTITPTVSSIFNFDFPASVANLTCSLIFLFPTQAQLSTSSFTFSGGSSAGSGAIDFARLVSPATNATDAANAPAVLTDFGATTVSPGNAYSISNFACPAGETVAFELSSVNGTSLVFMEDFNPSPIGLFVTEC
ncbi:MAG: hypothetical protein M1819_003261 [Sarea resinae]|nr:MAG: hypothetical protein M1819_003261 [Sarea resinae]